MDGPFSRRGRLPAGARLRPHHLRRLQQGAAQGTVTPAVRASSLRRSRAEKFARRVFRGGL
eukprot:6209427-Pleurochrysis_carterae.AAC.2